MNAATVTPVVRAAHAMDAVNHPSNKSSESCLKSRNTE